MNSERNKALLRGLRHIARAHEETAKVAAAVVLCELLPD